MLKVLFQIILIFLIFRLLTPVIRGVGRLFGSRSPKTRDGTTSRRESESAPGQSDYSELSQYEIEDAEFVEIKKEKENS